MRPNLSLSLSFCLVGAAAAGCGDDGGGPPAPSPITGFAVSGDFATTGVFSTIDVEGGTVFPNRLGGVAGGDPVLRDFGDELFIVNRDRGENVTVIGLSAIALAEQYGTGGGSNPQDVAVSGDKLYVPALGSEGVLVIDRTTRDVTTIAIEGDPDGQPNCVAAHAVGTRIYVACGLLDAAFMPRGPAKIAVIDATTDTVESSFDLPEANPIGVFAATPADSAFAGDLLIATAPSFNDFTTGCVARVSTGATPGANGCAFTNQALGGFANRIDVSPTGEALWLAVAGFSADFSSQFGRLHRVDAATGTVGAALSPATQLVNDVAACREGYVVAADATMGSSGMRIYQDGVEVTTAPLDIGRPTGPGTGVVCL